MLHRSRLPRAIACVLFSALVLFAVEDARGEIGLATDATVLHSHHESESSHHSEFPRGPLDTHASVGDHSAHSHLLILLPYGAGLIAANSTPTCVSGHSLPLAFLIAFEIEHPPRF
jgi:hypothetical protein